MSTREATAQYVVPPCPSAPILNPMPPSKACDSTIYFTAASLSTPDQSPSISEITHAQYMNRMSSSSVEAQRKQPFSLCSIWRLLVMAFLSDPPQVVSEDAQGTESAVRHRDVSLVTRQARIASSSGLARGVVLATVAGATPEAEMGLRFRLLGRGHLLHGVDPVDGLRRGLLVHLLELPQHIQARQGEV
eukprot:CAMPEP_0167772012 /NCGR_PEP_ID=MMETSP0111_2-20121227/605_1 /TAXON_ID=91324 /ORGANISM="Lotharella globosa, Strain CCCM811" /LENGTH=189 /DNA_ID=CAMNT_0007661445 /DNA_START=471 /DNA_END=1040 /DNA_ORIENTATION=+